VIMLSVFALGFAMGAIGALVVSYRNIDI